jgi:lysozyme
VTPAQKAGLAGGGAAAVLALATPLIMAWEGLRLDPYRDVAGIATVCWGETNVPMRRYTRAECDAMLAKSIEKHASPVLACLPDHAPLEVKAAFVSFGYNVGTSAACSSTAARRVREGRYPEACNALMAWVNAGGRRVQGLVNRRAAERELCLQGTLRRAQ